MSKLKFPRNYHYNMLCSGATHCCAVYEFKGFNDWYDSWNESMVEAAVWTLLSPGFAGRKQVTDEVLEWGIVHGYQVWPEKVIPRKFRPVRDYCYACKALDSKTFLAELKACRPKVMPVDMFAEYVTDRGMFDVWYVDPIQNPNSANVIEAVNITVHDYDAVRQWWNERSADVSKALNRHRSSNYYHWR